MKKPRIWEFTTPEAFAAAMADWLRTPEGKEQEERILAERARAAAEDATASADDRDREMALAGVPPKDVRLARGGKIETNATRLLAQQDGAALVVLSGNPGVGKTTAAALWLIGGWQPGCLFVKAATLSRWDCYDREQMDLLLDAPRMVIDDLGVEYADQKGRFLSVLTEVLDTRYDRALPTVMTTGLSAIEFKDRYRERISDRIRESGRFISIAGASMRGAAQPGPAKRS